MQCCSGKDREQAEDGFHVVSLAKAVNLLLKKDDYVKSLLAKAHTAGADAELHRLLFGAMVKLKNDTLGRA